MPDLITANKHLQDCYEKIGDADNMAVYAKRVQDILGKVDENRRAMYEKVLDDLTEADASPLVLNQLGNRALIRKEFSAAIRYYEKARKKSPKDAAILNNLAFTYIIADEDHRDLELAVQLVDEAIENLPANIDPRTKSTFLHTKATALKQAEQFEEALALFAEGLKARPDETTFACSLGSVEPRPASIFAELFWQRPVGIAVVEHVERPVAETDLAEPVVERVWLDLAAICGRHFVGLFEKRRVEPVAVEHAD
jgi:tetratricopeptide (TPR) repeat protein